MAEMDFGAAPPVEAALLDAVRRADFAYLTERAVAEMADACAGWQRDRYGWDVAPGRIRPLPDVISRPDGRHHCVLPPGQPADRRRGLRRGGVGHVRPNFGTPRPVLAEIVRRMAAAACG